MLTYVVDLQLRGPLIDRNAYSVVAASAPSLVYFNVLSTSKNMTGAAPHTDLPPAAHGRRPWGHDDASLGHEPLFP